VKSKVRFGFSPRKDGTKAVILNRILFSIKIKHFERFKTCFELPLRFNRSENTLEQASGRRFAMKSLIGTQIR